MLTEYPTIMIYPDLRKPDLELSLFTKLGEGWIPDILHMFFIWEHRN